MVGYPVYFMNILIHLKIHQNKRTLYIDTISYHPNLKLTAIESSISLAESRSLSA